MHVNTHIYIQYTPQMKSLSTTSLLLKSPDEMFMLWMYVLSTEQHSAIQWRSIKARMAVYCAHTHTHTLTLCYLRPRIHTHTHSHVGYTATSHTRQKRIHTSNNPYFLTLQRYRNRKTHANTEKHCLHWSSFQADSGWVKGHWIWDLSFLTTFCRWRCQSLCN